MVEDWKNIVSPSKFEPTGIINSSRQTTNLREQSAQTEARIIPLSQFSNNNPGTHALARLLQGTSNVLAFGS